MVRDEALQQAMNDYGHYLTRLSYVFVKDFSRAEDIVQNVFIKFYTGYECFEGRSSVKTYLYKMTVNECRNYLKSWAYRKQELTNTFAHAIHKDSPESHFVTNEGNRELAQTLRKLPTKYREVIWLHYYAELTVIEVAKVLDCTPNTVKTRLVRARKQLGKRLVEEGFDGT